MEPKKDKTSTKFNIGRGCAGVVTLFIFIPLLFVLWIYIGYYYDQYYNNSEYYFGAKNFLNYSKDYGIVKASTSDLELIVAGRTNFFYVSLYFIIGGFVSWKLSEFLFDEYF